MVHRITQEPKKVIAHCRVGVGDCWYTINTERSKTLKQHHHTGIWHKAFCVSVYDQIQSVQIMQCCKHSVSVGATLNAYKTKLFHLNLKQIKHHKKYNLPVYCVVNLKMQ